MSASIRSVALLALAFLLPGACAQKSPPAPVASLARPLIAVSASGGRVQIPQAAISERGGVPGVFVLATDGSARFRMVRTGKLADGRAEILAGLSGNETLVGGDLGDVRDGSPILKP